MGLEAIPWSYTWELARHGLAPRCPAYGESEGTGPSLPTGRCASKALRAELPARGIQQAGLGVPTLGKPFKAEDADGGR